MSGKRYSRQRELIYETLMHTDQHPTAEMVYQWLKPGAPNLSLGTVYRNLNLLVEEGVVSRMPFPVERYDANTKPHPHVQCGRCGGVYDLPLPYDPALDEKAREACEHEIAGHELLYHGTCAQCKGKSEGRV